MTARRFVFDLEEGPERIYLERLPGPVARWIRARVADRVSALIDAYGEARARMTAAELVGELAIGLEGGLTTGIPEVGVLIDELRETGMSAPSLVAWLGAQDVGR